MNRTIDLKLVPAGGYGGEEQPFCPFTDCHRSPMQYDDRGELVCPDCRTGAPTIEELVRAGCERVAS